MAEGAAREVGDLLGTGVWMIVVRRASYVDSWRFARARARLLRAAAVMDFERGEGKLFNCW